MDRQTTDGRTDGQVGREERNARARAHVCKPATSMQAPQATTKEGREGRKKKKKKKCCPGN